MRLVMVIDVPDARPELTDPHEVAEDLIEVYDENRSHVVESFEVHFVSAEWQ